MARARYEPFQGRRHGRGNGQKAPRGRDRHPSSPSWSIEVLQVIEESTIVEAVEIQKRCYRLLKLVEDGVVHEGLVWAP